MSTTVNWATGVSGDFAIPSNWTPPTVPGPTNDAALSPSGTYTVTSAANQTVNSLTTAAGATLAISGGIFTINNGTGAGANAGTMMASAGGTLRVSGPIMGSGAVVINGGVLDLAGSYAGVVTFTGPAGTFVGDVGNHNLMGDGLGNTLDYSNATTSVQFDLTTGNGYNNFGGPTVGVDHFTNISIFKGGSSNDFFLGGPGNHTFDGGAGTNTLDYSAATSAVQFNLLTGTASNNFGGGSTVGIDHFVNFQIFKAGSGGSTFFGGPGNKSLVGGAGVDTLDYSALAAPISLSFATGSAANGFGGTDLFTGIEVFKTGSGNDLFLGGPGNHVIDGGAGTNTLDYSTATTGVQFDIAGGRAYNNFGGPTVGVDQFSNIRIFKGGSGNDVFLGGPGDNAMDGGAGINTLDYSAASAAVTVNFVIGLAMNGYGGTDRWANIAVFKGGGGNDVFFGNGSGSGNFVFDGGGGINTLDYSTSAPTTPISIILSGHVFEPGGRESDDFSNIQVFKTGSGNDTFVKSFNNRLGDFTIDGGGGSNTLDYSGATVGAQFDVAHGNAYSQFDATPVQVDHFTNIHIFIGGSGNDVFLGGPGNNVFDGGAGINTLDYSAVAAPDFSAVAPPPVIEYTAGSAFNAFLGIDYFANIQIFKGGSGNDTFARDFRSGLGNYSLDGGGGSNTLDYSSAAVGAQFDVAHGNAYSQFDANPVQVDHFTNIQIFIGGSGNDVFLGGPGNNAFVGGAGTDTLDYSATSAPVSINLGTGAAMNGYGGTDHWSSIEVFKGGSGHNDFAASNAPGAYTWVGGATSDTFSFTGLFGRGTIANFTSGPDVINLDHTEFADFAAVQAHAQQVGNDTVITFDANDTITLQNTMLSNLHASDFHFV